MTQTEIIKKCPKCYHARIRYRTYIDPHFKCDFCGAEWNSKEGEIKT